MNSNKAITRTETKKKLTFTSVKTWVVKRHILQPITRTRERLIQQTRSKPNKTRTNQQENESNLCFKRGVVSGTCLKERSKKKARMWQKKKKTEKKKDKKVCWKGVDEEKERCQILKGNKKEEPERKEGFWKREEDGDVRRTLAPPHPKPSKTLPTPKTNKPEKKEGLGDVRLPKDGGRQNKWEYQTSRHTNKKRKNERHGGREREREREKERKKK